jgi:hypothetical protein
MALQLHCCSVRERRDGGAQQGREVLARLGECRRVARASGRRIDRCEGEATPSGRQNRRDGEGLILQCHKINEALGSWNSHFGSGDVGISQISAIACAENEFKRSESGMGWGTSAETDQRVFRSER